MKTIITLLMSLFLISTINSFSQVKIGDNPNTIDANSMLELESTNKGFLAPRMALNSFTSTLPLTAPVSTGMLVYSIGGTLTDGFYFWDGTKWLPVLSSNNTRNNYVLVKSAADFPPAVGGVITLVAGTVYEINGTIILTNKIDMNGCTVIGRDKNSDILLYTPTTGELFTGANGGTLQTLTLIAPGAGAKLFNLNAGGVVSKSIIIQNVYIFNCNNVGLIKDFGGYAIIQSTAFSNNTNGITFHNVANLIEINAFWIADNQNTYQTLIGTFTEIMFQGGQNEVLSAFSAKALDISGITSIEHGASLKQTFFDGNGTYVVGNFSNKWEVEAYGLPTEKDDVASGNIYVSVPATTTIASANTPYKILGTTISTNLFRTASPIDNRLTYTGQKAKRFQVICSLTSTFTGSGSNKYFTFYIAKNGVVLPESRQKVKLINNTDQGPMTLSCTVQLAPNDYIEVFVENNTDGTDIIAQSLNLSIK